MLAVLVDDYDVISLVETWLSPDVSSGEYFDGRYVVFRGDRSQGTSSKTRGGGTLLAIKALMEPVEIPSSLIQSVEQVWAKVKVGKTSVIFGSVYLPPNSPVSVYVDLSLSIETLAAANRDAKLVIMGDFNVPDVTWAPADDGHYMIPLDVRCAKAELLLGNLTLLGCEQLNSVGNHQGKHLDLMFSSVLTSAVSSPDVHLINPDVYHPPLTFDVCIEDFVPARPSFARPVLDFKKAPYDLINRSLSEIDWDVALNDDSVDSAVTTFYNILADIIDDLVPRKPAPNFRYPRWFSRKTVKLIALKQRRHCAYQRKRDDRNAYLRFADARRSAKRSMEADYTRYIECTQSSVKENIKGFWSYVNGTTGNNSLPKSMFLDNQHSSDLDGTCELFARFFAGNFKDEADLAPILVHSAGAFRVGCLVLTEEQVCERLNALDPHKGPGSDGIPALFLRSAAGSLARPLKIIFNKSLSAGVFPRIWRDAFITPVHKSGLKADVRNYRPISILCAAAKILESFVADLFVESFGRRVSLAQHGFLRGRSTTTNLVTLVEDVVAAFRDGSELHVIYTDFAKAFDRVNHKRLVRKLDALGVCDPLLSWLQSYLSDRHFIVRIKEHYSSSVRISSGVPQGSLLGPVLFTLFVDDVSELFVNSKCLLYADDLKVYKEIQTLADCLLLQQDLAKLTSWCDDNHLPLNVSKCCSIRFSRRWNPVQYSYVLGDVILSDVDSVRDLGVFLQRDLSFRAHIDQVTHKALKTLGFVKRITFSFRDFECLRLLYCSLVRSTLEYASSVWSPHQSTYIGRLERVQSNFSRYAMYRAGRDPDLPRSDRLELLKLQPLSTRRCCIDLRFLHKLCNGVVDAPILLGRLQFRVPARETRCNELFHVMLQRANYRSNSPICRMSRLYNHASSQLPEIDIFATTFGPFINALHNIQWA